MRKASFGLVLLLTAGFGFAQSKTFRNESANFEFTAPAGWVIKDDLTYSDNGTGFLYVHNPSYPLLKTAMITFGKSELRSGRSVLYEDTFLELRRFSQSEKETIQCMAFLDTNITVASSYTSYIGAEFGGTLQAKMVYGAAFKAFEQQLSILTSSEDRIKNRGEYYKIFQNMKFIDFAVSLQKQSPANSQRTSRQMFFDLLGRPTKPLKQVKALSAPAVGR